MRQLTALDAGFLLNERPEIPCNTTSVWIYEPPGGRREGLEFEDLLEYVRRRIGLVPLLHQRLLDPPGGLGLPWWVDDPHFELEYHVRHIGLAPPGDWSKFWMQVARLHARPLDRSRPLWEMYVMDGLDGMEGVAKGSFAIITTTHHAALDGVSALSYMVAMHTPDVPPTELPVPEELPSGWNLLGRSVVENARSAVKTVRVLGQVGASLLGNSSKDESSKSSRSSQSSRRPSRARDELPRFAPHSRFSQPISPRRVTDSVFVPLADIRAMRSLCEGSTVNDVATALFGGALRRYLHEAGERPVHSLRAVIPVSLRPRSSEVEAHGNHIALRTVVLGTDIADPVERLTRITAQTRSTRDADAEGGPVNLQNLLEAVPPGLMILTSPMFRGIIEMGSSRLVNTMVSNVPGPREPLYLKGAKMVRGCGVAPLVQGVGLVNHLTSYVDDVVLGFTACRDHVPDPERYTECIRQSFEEYKAAVEAATRRAAPARRSRPTSRATKKPAGAAGKAPTPTKSARTRKAAETDDAPTARRAAAKRTPAKKGAGTKKAATPKKAAAPKKAGPARESAATKKPGTTPAPADATATTKQTAVPEQKVITEPTVAPAKATSEPTTVPDKQATTEPAVAAAEKAVAEQSAAPELKATSEPTVASPPTASTEQLATTEQSATPEQRASTEQRAATEQAEASE